MIRAISIAEKIIGMPLLSGTFNIKYRIPREITAMFKMGIISETS